MARGRRRRFNPLTWLVQGVRALVLAVRHVRTGGASTTARARQRAASPPPRCPTCHQPVPHSSDYRDHLH